MQITIEKLVETKTATEYQNAVEVFGYGVSKSGDECNFSATIHDGYRGGEYWQRTTAHVEIGELSIEGVEAAGFVYNARYAGEGGTVKFREPIPGFNPTVTVTDAAELANVTEHSVYAVLQDDERRAVIFPGAYHTNPDNRRRGEWRIPRSEVEAWKPRRVKFDDGE